MIPKIFMLALLCISCLPDCLQADSRSWLFVSLLRDQQIVAYERDAKSGQLTRRSVTNFPAEPGVLCVSRDRKTLFVAFRSTGQLASFRIEPESGRLAPISTVVGGDDPAYLEVDRTGRFFVTAYYVANKVTVHPIASDGAIGKAPLQTCPTAKNTHGILLGGH